MIEVCEIHRLDDPKHKHAYIQFDNLKSEMNFLKQLMDSKHEIIHQDINSIIVKMND